MTGRTLKQFLKLYRGADETAFSEQDAEALTDLMDEFPELQALFEEEESSRAALFAASSEVVVDDRFTDEVLAGVAYDSQRRTLRYWIPTIVGASVAACMILALLQLVAQSDQLKPINVTGHEARRVTPASPQFPTVMIRDSSTFR